MDEFWVQMLDVYLVTMWNISYVNFIVSIITKHVLFLNIFFYNFTMWKSKYNKFYKNQLVFRDNMKIFLLRENIFSYEQTFWHYNEIQIYFIFSDVTAMYTFIILQTETLCSFWE